MMVGSTFSGMVKSWAQIKREPGDMGMSQCGGRAQGTTAVSALGVAEQPQGYVWAGRKDDVVWMGGGGYVGGQGRCMSGVQFIGLVS